MGHGTSGRLSGRTIGKSCNAVCDPHRTRGGDGKLRFGGLGLKTIATVSWFGPQNQGERRFVSLRLKTDGRMKTVWRHTSTSGGLLSSESSHARVT